MKKTVNNLQLLNAIFIASLLTSNVIAVKVITFWGLVVPAAVIVYPLTFLMTDIIGEIWGKESSGKTVRNGLICQVLALVFIGIALVLPIAPFATDFQIQFAAVLGQSARVIVASLVAYSISQTTDVVIFHRLKAKTGRGKKWLRNNLSTMTSQLLDTAVFILIAFWGTVPNIWIMILSQYLIKVVYALLDTPFFYLLTKEIKES